MFKDLKSNTYTNKYICSFVIERIYNIEYLSLA